MYKVFWSKMLIIGGHFEDVYLVLTLLVTITKSPTV